MFLNTNFCLSAPTSFTKAHFLLIFLRVWDFLTVNATLSVKRSKVDRNIENILWILRKLEHMLLFHKQTHKLYVLLRRSNKKTSFLRIWGYRFIQAWGKGTEGTYQTLYPGRVTWPGWTECLRLQEGCRWREDNDPAI